MIYRDPKCVYVADTATEGQAIVLFLAERGISAEVMNASMLTDRAGFGHNAITGRVAEGLEIWVKQESQAADAIQLLADHEQWKTHKSEQAAALGPVEATCEECGAVSKFPGDQRGTVQTCQHCRAYLDVPGVEDMQAEPNPDDEP
jgi:hypothetical protein